MNKDKITELMNRYDNMEETIIQVLKQNVDLETEKYQKLEDTIEIIGQLVNQNVVYDSITTCFETVIHYGDQVDEIDLYDCKSLPELRKVCEKHLAKVKNEIDKWESLIEYIEKL